MEAFEWLVPPVEGAAQRRSRRRSKLESSPGPGASVHCVDHLAVSLSTSWFILVEPPVSVTHKMSDTLVWFSNDEYESVVFQNLQEFFKPKQQGDTSVIIIYGKGNWFTRETFPSSKKIGNHQRCN